MARAEKTFQTEIKRACDYWGRVNKKSIFYFKPPDLGFRNPFDCFIIANGTAYGIEAKFNKAVKTFNFEKFFNKREHQKGYLQLMKSSGGQGIVIINHFNKKHRINKTYSLTIEQVFEIGSKTISLSELRKIAIEIRKAQGEWQKYWDLSKIIGT